MGIVPLGAATEDVLIKIDQGAGIRRGVLADPAVRDLCNGHRIEEVQLVATLADRGDQVRLLQDAQVLADTEAGHLGESRPKATGGLAVAFEQQIEDRSAGRIGQSLEDVCPFLHATIIGDHMVTCEVLLLLLLIRRLRQWTATGCGRSSICGSNPITQQIWTWPSALSTPIRSSSTAWRYRSPTWWSGLAR